MLTFVARLLGYLLVLPFLPAFFIHGAFSVAGVEFHEATHKLGARLLGVDYADRGVVGAYRVVSFTNPTPAQLLLTNLAPLLLVIPSIVSAWVCFTHPVLLFLFWMVPVQFARYSLPSYLDARQVVVRWEWRHLVSSVLSTIIPLPLLLARLPSHLSSRLKLVSELLWATGLLFVAWDTYPVARRFVVGVF